MIACMEEISRRRSLTQMFSSVSSRPVRSANCRRRCASSSSVEVSWLRSSSRWVRSVAKCPHDRHALPGTWNAIMPEHPVLDPTLSASDPDLLTKDPRTNPLLMIEAQGRYDRQIINALKDNPQVAALGLTDIEVMLSGYNGGASYQGVVNAMANNPEYGGYHNKVLKGHLPKFQLNPGSPPQPGAPR